MTRLFTTLSVLILSGALAAGCNSGSRPSAAGGTTGTTGQAVNGTYLLTLNVAGTGSGTITVAPPSANGRYAPGTNLTLTANSDPGATFVDWGGDLAGTQSLTVQLVVQNNVTLGPVFDAVAAGSPVAEFVANPDPAMGIAPLTVTLQDQSTAAPTGWIWDFGDGTTDTTQNPTHTFTQPGTYSVSLRVSNANGPGTPILKTALIYVADPSEGSRFWYETDRYQNPFKSNNATEASLAQQVLDLVNQERVTAGVAPVLFDAEAERAAKVHVEDMLARNYFDHVTPEGWTPGDRLQMTGASGYQTSGENLAVGQQTAAAVMNAWMNSAGHRANILNPIFTHLGVGVANGPNWTQLFLVR
ncbi:MAG: PKD domain-containing protein [Planctomycetes bacterium]|nr:PKD domain-containing protein [Planctomycetota bacterium]